MPKTIKANRVVGQQAETAVAQALRAAEFEVTDLNDLARNFPLADFVARRGAERLLVQVRGTATRAQWFRMTSETARKFAALADALGHHAIYAFVHVNGIWPTIRFGIAEHVEYHIVDNWWAGLYEGLSLDERGLVGAHCIDRLWAEDRDDMLLPDGLTLMS